MLKTVLCCASVFGLILLIGWLLGLIMIHLFKKKIRGQKPQAVTVYINDPSMKKSTYTIEKLKRVQQNRGKRVEGFACGCHKKGKKIKQKVRPPKPLDDDTDSIPSQNYGKTAKKAKTSVTPDTTGTSDKADQIEHFDPFIGKYQKQSKRAERRLAKSAKANPLTGYNIKEYGDNHIASIAT